jgi:hypothetical protein
MNEKDLFNEMVRGGRGQCPKCLEVVNNVAYHMAHDCKPECEHEYESDGGSCIHCSQQGGLLRMTKKGK